MRSLVLVVAALVVAGCASTNTSSPAAGIVDVAARASTIEEEGLRRDLEALASDAMEGRGPGTAGDLRARTYIVNGLAAAGVSPAAADGSWMQPVPITGIRSTVTRPLQAFTKDGGALFVEREDWTCFAYAPKATSRIDKADVVFVGYGITAPDQRWDDFKDVDVRGKVVMIMNDDPSSDPELFAGKTRLFYGRWTYKYEEARRRGAVGAIIIHTTPSAAYPFQVVQSNHGQERCWLPFVDEKPFELAMWMTEEASRKLAALGGRDLDGLRKSAESRDFRPVALDVQVSVGTSNVVRALESANVVGVMEGHDPRLRDEAVVVTAHFDHLGIGTPKNGDAIYNGALDNASGCAGFLALARALKDAKPRRSILFLAVTAEEQGLLGSEWYARHPTWERRNIVANFNFDGMNIWGRTRDLRLVGYGRSTLTEDVLAEASTRGRKVLPDANPETGMFYRSDHFNFARIGVPSVYPGSGSDFLEDGDTRRSVQRSYTALHYHQPSDEIDARWRLDGAVDDLRLWLAVLSRVADADRRPKWTKGDEFEKER